ncbi:hypothetical protein FSP39_018932 [Pinctada imbricata]|uniref:Uncharacterized protein n=2 Tax=Pinctada imbricata TaxID=66713 RepID=A0AA88Y673_PINIB|nr:hypothetical protein FSP39_018932 [Pinctada imbricata]
MVRRQGIQYWMNFFQDLTEAELHDGGYLDQELSRFCFLGMVQDTLDDIRCVWNRHRIRPYRQRNHISGRPFMLYFMPSMCSAMDYGLEQNSNDVQICEEEIDSVPTLPCSDLIKDLCVCIMQENQITLPENPKDMRDLYIFLREDINNSL